MAGKKGRSGRKPRKDGLKFKAIAMYIEHSGKTPITWFRFFKRIYGSRWQEKVRGMMQREVSRYKEEVMWICNCTDPVLRYHFKWNDMCHGCKMYKNEITRRIYER